MNAKERVKRAISYNKVDRLPLGLFGTRTDYEERFCKYLKIDTIEEMYRKMGVDIWHSKVNLEYQKSGHIFGITPENPHPFANITSIEELQEIQFPTMEEFTTEKFTEHMKSHQEFFLCGGINSAIFHNFLDLCGQENGLCLLKLEPELAYAMVEKITDFWVAYLRKLLQAGNGMIDMIENCNDFGTQKSTFISLDDFRQFFKPQLQRLYDTAKEFGVSYMQHSCGSIMPFIDDFIEMGADILNPIQVEAEGMVIAELVEKYKGKIAFYGGIDTQHLLPRGSTAEIRAAVRNLKSFFGNDGGLIMAGSQGLMDDVPFENAFAYMDENLNI